LSQAAFTTNQPLEKNVVNILKDEINVEKIIWKKEEGDINVTLDIKITPELRRKGKARDLIRRIQQERKKLKVDMSEEIELIIPEIPSGFEAEIKRKTLAAKIKKGKDFKVEKAKT
jgi:hypothetical protein